MTYFWDSLSLYLPLSLSLLSHFSSSFTHSLCLFHSLPASPPHFLLTVNPSTSFFVIYSLSFSIYCLSIAFLLLVCLFSASLLLSPSFSLMYAFFIPQFVSLPQPIIIFLYSHPPTPPPLYPSLVLYRSYPCFYSSLPAPRVSWRETSRAVVPAEQLPCKAIQIEMFAENNMCVITA